MAVRCICMHGGFLSHGSEDGTATVWSLELLARKLPHEARPLHVLQHRCKVTALALRSSEMLQA